MQSPGVPETVEQASPAEAVIALKLVVASGPSAGRELVLERGARYRVGRSAESALPLDDESVSSHHLTLEVMAASVRMTDAGSRNGSFCQGARFSSLEARPGMVVRVGSSELRLLPRVSPAPALRPSSLEHFGPLKGKSLAMREIFALLERLAAADATVLIDGETGTGKDLCARALHEAGARRKGPLLSCDLGALSPSVIESELFGHVRGAFSGASTSRPGVFAAARSGTLVLDDVGDLPLEQQPLLLGALERKRVRPLGSNEDVALDVRVIALSRKNLSDEVAAGRFRADLFHRLSAVRVTLPPLRERPDDIPLLVDHFLAASQTSAAGVSAETRALLACYRWPGNVRELKHAVERVVALGGPGAPADEARSDAAAPDLTFKEAKDRLLAAFERDFLVELLDRCEGNVSKAARAADLDRVYLGRLIKKYGIDLARVRAGKPGR